MGNACMAAKNTSAPRAPSQGSPKKGKRRGEARSLRREGEGPGRKSKDKEERINCTCEQTAMGGSLYNEEASVLAFLGRECMHLSAFLRGLLRAIVCGIPTATRGGANFRNRSKGRPLKRSLREGREGDTQSPPRGNGVAAPRQLQSNQRRSRRGGQDSARLG